MAETEAVDTSAVANAPSEGNLNINYVNYQSEAQMPDIRQLIQRHLSEPYSVYTYRYFINNWGKLCFLAYDDEKCVGAIVCKLDTSEKSDQQNRFSANDINEQPNRSSKITYKGYIAMLVVEKEYRKMKIGSNLVKMAINAMKECDADEVVLETETTNKPSLKLYENLGFIRDKRLFRYYLNGLDAFRLKLWLS